LRPSRVRKPVRRDAERLTKYTADTGILRPLRENTLRLAGHCVLWLTDSSVRVQTFAGDVEGIDAAGVSSALAGFLPEIGSPTRIGQPGPIDPRLETAAFDATTVAQDIEKALSEAPYGKAAAALLSLADRVLPRDRLFLGGYILESTQKGLGLTVTLTKSDGSVLESEMIWSGDFDPAITSNRKATRETSAPPLTLALVAAVWLTFVLTERSGQRNIEQAFGTASWQAFALVRVGLQGGAKRPALVTQEIYARACEADAERRTGRSSDDPVSPNGCYRAASYNLALAQLRRDRYRFGPLYLRARETLSRLAQSEPEDLLTFSVAFNEAVALINAYHAGRAGLVEVSRGHASLLSAVKRLERQLMVLESGAQSEQDARFVRQLEAPMIGLWAALDLACRHDVARSDGTVGSRGVQRLDREKLVLGLKSGTLTHDDVVRGYLVERAIDARTRYNLACYWSARGDQNAALRELAISLESGTVGGAAATDPGLFVLSRAQPAEFRALLLENDLPVPTARQ